MSKISVSHDGKTPLSVLYAEARSLIRAGFEIIKPRKPERPTVITTNERGVTRKKRKPLTTADVEVKERQDEKLIMITTGSTKKSEKEDSPFRWSKGNWR